MEPIEPTEIQSPTTSAKRPGPVTLAIVMNILGIAASFIGIIFLAFYGLVGAGAGLASVEGSDPAAMAAGAGILAVAFGVFGFIIILILIANIILLVGLLNAKRWAWTMQIILAALKLIDIPLGTVIGGIILYYFFQPETKAYFGMEASS